ncbi:MAG TPA: cyclic-di-AMP receptor [Thermoclostridium sp.]|nr:cyclic-di-AMP receptor [Thermoclostridium sp.]
MKLIMAIISDEDSNSVISELGRQGFGVTKLCSTGGFLRSGNTTIMIGADEEKISEVTDIIRKKCKTRKKAMPNLDISGSTGITGMAFPVEVTVGGATVFVLNVEQFEKL